LGEVTQGMTTTVCFPTTAFNTILNVLTYTEDYIKQNLPNNGDLFPAQPAVANDVTAVSTRYLMYLPSRYVQLFLDASGYTIQQVWQVLPDVLLQHNDTVTCQALIKWLRVASHDSTGHNAQGQALRGPPLIAIPLVSPVADKDLLNQRAALLKQALPGLGQPTVGLESALLQMAQAVVMQTNDQRLVRDAKAAEALQPTLSSTKFKNTLPILMEYLQVQDEQELPTLWHQWANSTKRQEFSMLQELLDTYSHGVEFFYSMAPVVSAKLVQDLLSFTFIGDSQEDLKSGLQPLIVADGSEEYRQANLELAKMYSLLHDSEYEITYNDLLTLEAKEVRSIPLSYFELEECLGMFGNLLGVAIGSTHELSVTYRHFWDLLMKGMRNDLQIIIDTTGRIKPAHILRSIQLTCYSWFNHKRACLRPPLPDFVNILHHIALQSFVLPHLPPALFRMAYPATSKSLGPPSYTPSVTGTSVTLQGSDISNISTITSPAVTASKQSAIRDTLQANLTPDSTLQSLIPANLCLKDLIGTDSPPLVDDTTPLCLSYHMCQGCWSTCKHVNTHKSNLSIAEKQRIATFALAQLPKRLSTSTASVPP
jgi:hypothetical protein